MAILLKNSKNMVPTSRHVGICSHAPVLLFFATITYFRGLTLNTFSSHATYSLRIPRDFPKDAKINIETRTMIKGGRKKL